MRGMFEAGYPPSIADGAAQAGLFTRAHGTPHLTGCAGRIIHAGDGQTQAGGRQTGLILYIAKVQRSMT